MALKFPCPLVECAKDFAQKVKDDTKYHARVSRVLAAPRSTVYNWLGDGKVAEGINFFKLCLLLKLNGYQVSEIQKLRPQIREFGEWLAMGVFEMDVALNALGFGCRRNVFRTLSGRAGTNRLAGIENALSDSALKEIAKRKLQEWRQAVVFTEETKVLEETSVQTPQPGQGTKALVGAISHETALRILAYQVKAMVPLAEWIVSNQFTADERRKLRELSGNGHSNNVFELSTLLNRLCSETARKEMQ